MHRVARRLAYYGAVLTIAGGLTAAVSPTRVAADPIEVTETFLATGYWTMSSCGVGCTQVSGSAVWCEEVEVVGDLDQPGCLVSFTGKLYGTGSSFCSLGAVTGSITATFADESDPSAYDSRQLTAVGVETSSGDVITVADDMSPDAAGGELEQSIGCPYNTYFALTFTANVLSP